MSLPVFILVFATGSAAIALWIGVRFPRIAPTTLTYIMVHVAACWAIAQFAAPAGMQWAIARGSVFAAVFLVAFPAIVYFLLAGFWMLRYLASSMGNYAR